MESVSLHKTSRESATRMTDPFCPDCNGSGVINTNHDDIDPNDEDNGIEMQCPICWDRVENDSEAF